MQDSEFHRVADQTLETIEKALEDASPEGLECDRMGNTLTVTLPTGRQLVLNKHTPSQELWLASPASGGLHFRWRHKEGWVLKDGRHLAEVLSDDFAKLMSLTISFPNLKAS